MMNPIAVRLYAIIPTIMVGCPLGVTNWLGILAVWCVMCNLFAYVNGEFDGLFGSWEDWP